MLSPRVWALCLTFGVLSTSSARAALITENFDSVAALASRGWVTANRSAPAGATGWFQGEPAIFGSQSGASDSYIAANFLGAAPGGDISTWLFTPILLFDNATTVTFFTRTVDGPIAPDRLEVRLSLNAGSTFVGSGAATVGDFTQLLLTVNPLLSLTGYPETWTAYTLTLGGLPGAAYGRLGFRYVVPDTSVNGDYIGIDSFETDALPTPEPASLTLLGLGLAGGLARRLRRRAGASR